MFKTLDMVNCKKLVQKLAYPWHQQIHVPNHSPGSTPTSKREAIQGHRGCPRVDLIEGKVEDLCVQSSVDLSDVPTHEGSRSRVMDVKDGANDHISWHVPEDIKRISQCLTNLVEKLLLKLRIRMCFLEQFRRFFISVPKDKQQIM